MSIYRIENNKLIGPKVKYLESPNHSGNFESPPQFIILHYTALTTVDEVVDIFTDVTKEVSAHFVVGRGGEILQFVPLNIIGWHAGVSHWREFKGLNYYSTGIEIDNAGKLTKEGDTYYSWQGIKIPEEEVFRHIEGGEESFWHK